MDQRTHSWIAIRAIALLEDEGKEPNLVSLLKPNARKASVGAWIPDQTDAKRGGVGNITECHVLKMEPYKGDQKKRFVVQKKDLLKNIGDYRKTALFLQQDTYLDDQWWKTPFKGDVSKPGQHLPNRITALSTMLIDLLLLGDQKLDDLIPGSIKFDKYLDPDLRTPEEAASMYFFMASHFIADVCMPCHCDGRKLAGYDKGLHKELEAHWSKTVGEDFERDNLLKDAPGKQILQQAKAVDAAFGLNFDSIAVPDIRKGNDVWLEAVYLCRASFSLASIIAPYKTYPYDNTKPKAPFKQVLGGANSQVLAELNQTVMFDAVLNTAIIWKHIWNKVSKEED